MLMFMYNQIGKTNMAEEEKNRETITNDDIMVLRVLLHDIKGLSPVSSTTNYLTIDNEPDRS